MELISACRWKFAAELTNPDVLVLCYEELQADLRGHLDLIASFMGLELASSDLDKCVQLNRGFLIFV